MGIINSLIVFFLFAGWFLKYGEELVETMLFKDSKALACFCWGFLIWGIINLFY